MHNHLIKAIIVLFITSFSPILSQSIENANSPSNMGSLSVKIIGFESNEGKCRFALDSSETIYESDDLVFIGKVLPIINKEVIVRIDSLNFGVYAIRVFHDENSNEELDTDFLGIPTEDYGYSNNASSWFGPPSWEKTKFIFNKEELTIEISVE